MNNPEGDRDVLEPQGSKPLSSKVSSTTATRTLRKRKERVAHTDLDPVGDEYQATHPDYSIEPLPPSKKRKARKGATVSNKLKGRKKGKLASLLLIMPIEVLCEIYSFLSPLDLIHVARAAKIFALFLLHPSAATMWRAARVRILDLPDIHDDLTEQQFANLLFGSICNRCGKGPIRKVNWTLRRRWCEACRDEILRGLDPDYSPFDFSPYEPHPVGRSQYIWGSRRYQGFVMDTRKVQAIENELCDDPIAEEQLYEEYVGKGRKISEHAEACQKWQGDKDAERAKKLDKLRQERLLSFRTRLTQIGWTHNILEDINFAWYRLPTIHQCRLLSESDWRKLRPQAELMLAEVQTMNHVHALEVLSARARTAYNDWLQNQPLHDWCQNQPVYSEILSSCPSPNWISTHPHVMKLLQRHAEEHSSDIVYKNSFELPAELNNLFSVITKTRQDEVSKIFHDALPLGHRLADPMSSLKLATSVFLPRRGGAFGLHYPELGLYTRGRPSAADDFYDHSSPWPSEEWWKFDVFGSQLMRQILIACQLDPATTTITDLKTLDPRLVCKTCSPPGSDYGPTMSWRRALLHWNQMHGQTPASEAPWRALSPCEKSAFLEEYGDHVREPSLAFGWRCGLCPWYAKSCHPTMIVPDIACAHRHGMQDHDHEKLLVPDPWTGFESTEPVEIDWEPPPRSVGVRNPL